MSYLGVDLGTSGMRVLLCDAAGEKVGSVQIAYPTHAPQPGWSEQDPALWIAALDTAVAQLRATYPAFSDLRAIAVSGHMHGAVLLDDAAQVLRPCILWNDTRSHAEAAALDAHPAMRRLSGNIAFPGFTAPKLAWVRRHEPEIYARIAKVLLPAAFLNWYLSGAYVGDLSDAAGTAWLDTGARRWSDELLALTGLTPDHMPRLVEGCAPAGQLRPDLARKWGLTGRVTIAGGAADNAAAACGVGAMAEGQGFVSLGTSGVLLLARDGYHPVPETALHTFCHAVPGTWYQMGVMLAATDSLNWFARITGAAPADLTAALGDRLAAPGPVGFWPYLSGERTPHNDTALRGSFSGLSTQTDTADMTRAILEGVAFALRDSAEIMRASGAQLDRLDIVGGGAASDYWVRLIATILQTPIHRPSHSAEAAAKGAVRLAMAAANGGEYAAAPSEDAEIFEPDPQLTDRFNDAYQRFRDGVECTRPRGECRKPGPPKGPQQR